MKISLLLEEMFKEENWIYLLNKSVDKGLNKSLIRKLQNPIERSKLFNLIAHDKYQIVPPRVAKIPKDKPNEFREVYINTDLDRIVLSLINDCLFILFGDMVHKSCRSYQKGIGTQEVVKQISDEIVILSKQQHHIGYKFDFKKYFDTVKVEYIDTVFDKIESRLGFEKSTEQVMNLLRRYYHQHLYFDSEGNLCERYQSLKQGCSVASFLADVVLYELDEYMSNKYKIYYRYSDDLVVIDKDTHDVINEINGIVGKYGVMLNPKKVEPLYSDKWFKFLGFMLKGNLITLSKTRIKRFQHEIEKRTIRDKKKSLKSAKRCIIKYLYEGDHAWATSCLGILNVDEDMDVMDNFIKDCLRSCVTKHCKLGGLGSCFDKGDRTVFRGKGRNVKQNREKTEKIFENYYSVKCMANALKLNKSIYKALVSDMLN